MRCQRVLERRDHARIVTRGRGAALPRRHVGVRIGRVVHRHGPMVSWGYHGLPWGWRDRIRVTPRGRTAHGRDFSAESKATIRAGLGGVGRKLEGGGDGGVAGIDLDALTGEDVVEIIEVEGGVVSLEERFALEELALDALGVSAGCQCLTVTILLVARGAGGGAGGAAGMLGVALGEEDEGGRGRRLGC